MDNLFWIGFIGAVLALAFAWIQRGKVMAYSEGTEKMQKIAASIREGANAYLKHQYTTVAKVFIVVFVLLLIIAFASNGKMLSKFTPFAFVTGGIFSMLAGFIGMKIATSSNARTAQAASESLNKGLRVAFSSGSVMGFTVVGLGMLDITVWFFLLRYVFGIDDASVLGNIMVMNGMGASFMALFARVGGGIYTKAADVGADLVGKVEAGIPEDDPRNPATIADNVGDNVGDVAGMGADLYESYVGSILATFALSAVGGYGYAGMMLPLALAVVGIICSILGSFLVKTEENATQQTLLKSLLVADKDVILTLCNLVTTGLSLLCNLCNTILYGLKIFELKLCVDNALVANRIYAAVYVSDIAILKATQNVNNSVCVADVCKELVAKTLAL